MDINISGKQGILYAIKTDSNVLPEALGQCLKLPNALECDEIIERVMV